MFTNKNRIFVFIDNRAFFSLIRLFAISLNYIGKKQTWAHNFAFMNKDPDEKS